MVIKKTSIAIEENEWKEWLSYSILKTGSARKASDLLADAMKEYRKNHPIEG
jgi:hypothetical protein